MRKNSVLEGYLASLGSVAVFVFLLTLLVTSEFLGRSHTVESVGLDTVPIPSRLAQVFHPRQLALDGCRVVDSYEERQLSAWKRALTLANNEQISGDTVLRKVSLDTVTGSGGGTRARVACLIPSVNADGRARKAYDVWGKKCDSTLIITNKAAIDQIDRDRILEVHPPKDDKNSWQRLRIALRHVSGTPALHDGNDFFLYAGDDSFVIVENLRKMLQEPYIQYLHAANAPLYLGHRMVQTGTNAPFVSGTAFILNRAALDILVAVSENANCDPTTYSESEDILIAACFRHHNIYPLNTQDVFGEDRLHMFDAAGVASIIRDPNIANWYPPYRRKVMPKALDGVSRYSFHFHGVSEESMADYANRVSK